MSEPRNSVPEYLDGLKPSGCDGRNGDSTVRIRDALKRSCRGPSVIHTERARACRPPNSIESPLQILTALSRQDAIRARVDDRFVGATNEFAVRQIAVAAALCYRASRRPDRARRLQWESKA
jgi:hypothetical protein